MHHCLVPHDKAQLLMYHHLHPFPASFDLSQKAPGNSKDSPRISKGIIPVGRFMETIGRDAGAGIGGGEMDSTSGTGESL